MNNMFSNYLTWQINTELDSLFAIALNFTSQRKHVYRIENISCNILVKISPTICINQQSSFVKTPADYRTHNSHST